MRHESQILPARPVARAGPDDHGPSRAARANPGRVAVGDVVRLWRKRLAERRALRQLALFEPDSVLEDSGWSREDARREADTPFWRP